MNTFRGGLRFSKDLRSAKELALQIPLRLFTPKALHLSLQIGCTVLQPVVENRSYVRVGEPVAVDPSGKIPPLHSGLSGTLYYEEGDKQSSGESIVTALSIVGDGRMLPATPLPRLSDDADADAIVQRMYDAGLVGLGGAGFPTFLKYRKHHAHHLLINACECEPYLAGDGRVVIDQPETVRDGIALLSRAGGVSADHVVLCAESASVFEGLRRIADGTGWQVCRLPKRYPQGSEKQLIASVLGLELPQGVYPADWGIPVSNVATASAMADAARGLPLTHRSVTVSGLVRTPCNLIAPIGTPFRELIAHAEPLVTGRHLQWIAGGAMTGKRLAYGSREGLPKTCGGVLVLPVNTASESSCIRCGACVRVCPSGLMPYLIDRAHLRREAELCRQLHAEACIACGCCSYVCPAKRQLAARISVCQRPKGETGT